MNVRNYLKDHITAVSAFLTGMVLMVILNTVFRVSIPCTVSVLVICTVCFLLVLTHDYWKRQSFYQHYQNLLSSMDQKYLITEMIEEPDFTEGQLLYESLYEINKSMKEQINRLENADADFREYVEMWVHEIKLPLSALTLMNYNDNTDIEKQRLLLGKVNHYVEQILFYVRADAAEKDYLIKECNLEDCVNKAVMQNKELLISNHFKIEKNHLSWKVYTDSKWMIFILGQIISNSAKYFREEERSVIFSAYKDTENDTVTLAIEDHGIGIPKQDISRVFDKSFTGENGRKQAQSTGMGLYICRKLCDKLGHNIRIESEEQKYTRVLIEFGIHDFYLTNM